MIFCWSSLKPEIFERKGEREKERERERGGRRVRR
jgi:hypothetical protein